MQPLRDHILTFVGILVLVLIPGRGRAADGEAWPPRVPNAFEEVLRARAELKRAIRLSSVGRRGPTEMDVPREGGSPSDIGSVDTGEDGPAGGQATAPLPNGAPDQVAGGPADQGELQAGDRAWSFDAGIPLADEWVFLKGGSFGLCSDDIVIFVLFHPRKDILKILSANYTGTVETGRFLIDDSRRRIVVSQECLGNDPPRRFVIDQGVPRADRRFDQAFVEAFRHLAARLQVPPRRYSYSRELSFQGPDRRPCLELRVSPLDGESPEVPGTILLGFDEDDGRVTTTFPSP